jgi:aspartyl aminopeptidase
LANLIATELKIEIEDIQEYDLILYDTHPSRLFGISKEFVASGRLDNLGSSLTSADALINSANDIFYQTSINIISLFDNEEVGSLSYQGADCQFFAKGIQRIFNNIASLDTDKNIDEAFHAACARSFILSCDMAHAFHPNYSEKYQSEHKPLVHGGITLKINPTNRYATDAEGAGLVKAIGKKANVPIQDFIVRQDSPCGTTIGPIIASNVGIKTVDIGIPQLAMHSIREMCGVLDLLYYRNFFEEFFSSYEELIGNLNIK